MCKNLQKIVNETLNILDRHIDEHQKYTGLEIQKASQDFINKYSFVVREVYCDLVCGKKNSCEEYQDYLKYSGWNK